MSKWLKLPLEYLHHVILLQVLKQVVDAQFNCIIHQIGFVGRELRPQQVT